MAVQAVCAGTRVSTVVNDFFLEINPCLFSIAAAIKQRIMETVSVMMQAVVKQYALHESQQRAKAEERLLIVKELYAEDMARRLQVCAQACVIVMVRSIYTMASANNMHEKGWHSNSCKHLARPG